MYVSRAFRGAERNDLRAIIEARYIAYLLYKSWKVNGRLAAKVLRRELRRVRKRCVHLARTVYVQSCNRFFVPTAGAVRDYSLWQ